IIGLYTERRLAAAERTDFGNEAWQPHGYGAGKGGISMRFPWAISSVAVVCLSIAPVAFAGTPTPFAPPAAGTPTLYRNATLFDGTGASPRPHMDVLVDGDRIVAVFPDAKKPPSARNAHIVDLTGKYLLPGLIDSHVHLSTPPNRRQAEAAL